ncbi:hypothetical protein PsYK624_156440 [Phanerochaete sordida]|uniref:Uncharacterized protein n=1 Tax=Phanerochaete sordida TaxID=48140 RepID=A0A9P3GTD4_9APHY|nr:hypothetical protein PsYK624_156440 [Phanerochaete sordida]
MPIYSRNHYDPATGQQMDSGSRAKRFAAFKLVCACLAQKAHRQPGSACYEMQRRRKHSSCAAGSGGTAVRRCSAKVRRVGAPCSNHVGAAARRRPREETAQLDGGPSRMRRAAGLEARVR